ncbi:MAG: hypothetical protein RBR71_14220 [Gudongella sp.]|nr:hypothetical protein [Gudongella sp.]
MSQADGYADAFYLKFTTPKQSNLIIGTSKAAQGIQPRVLNNILHKNFYNYSFGIYSSPYGSVYLNSIKRKLNEKEDKNIFILTVDPWSICSLNESINDSANFSEVKSFLNDITNVCKKPNFKYLFKHFEGNYYRIFSKNSPFFLHDDGWLEISLNEEQQSRIRRTNFTINDYRKKLDQFGYSSVRFSSLLETIDYLKKFGKVYLVRLPVHPDLMKIEETLMPNFNSSIKLAIGKSNGYLDLASYNSILEYTDGVHLNVASSEIISTTIAQWIKSN